MNMTFKQYFYGNYHTAKIFFTEVITLIKIFSRRNRLTATTFLAKIVKPQKILLPKFTPGKNFVYRTSAKIKNIFS
jgi:hypothetical protein